MYKVGNPTRRLQYICSECGKGQTEARSFRDEKRAQSNVGLEKGNVHVSKDTFSGQLGCYIYKYEDLL